MGPHSSPRVLCFGEALVDRLLPVGEDLTAVVAGACEDRLGGAPANVACGLARLGTPAALLGCLGTDSIGQAFAALFAERGVESGGIQWTSRRPSRVVLVRRDGSGESGFGGFLGDRGLGFADQDLDAEALYRAVLPWLAQADWLLCGTLALASPGSAAALDRLLALLPAPAAPPGKAAAGRPSLAEIGRAHV